MKSCTGRQRADGWRWGAVPAVVRAAPRPESAAASPGCLRQRAVGRREEACWLRRPGRCGGPGPVAEAELEGDDVDVAHVRPRPEAACRARCRCRPARVRRIPDSASRPVHPIRLEQVASSRGRGHRVAEKASLRCSPLGRRRCTVAVPREERARAVVETGPRGKHGATQEPHSAPAQDA